MTKHIYKKLLLWLIWSFRPWNSNWTSWGWRWTQRGEPCQGSFHQDHYQRCLQRKVFRKNTLGGLQEHYKGNLFDCLRKSNPINVRVRFKTSCEVVVSFALSFFLNSHLYFYFIRLDKIDDKCWNLIWSLFISNTLIASLLCQEGKQGI